MRLGTARPCARGLLVAIVVLAALVLPGPAVVVQASAVGAQVRGEPTATPDADGDGLVDTADNCPGMANADQIDADGDGLGDVCDETPFPPPPDRDGDTVTDDVDNCADVANADQRDSDGDGAGDVCDATPFPLPPDGDGDGAPDGTDNCEGLANPDQTDADGDGAGDACDAPDPTATTAPPAAPTPVPTTTVPSESAAPTAPPEIVPPTASPEPGSSGPTGEKPGFEEVEAPPVPGVAMAWPAPYVLPSDAYEAVVRINAGGPEVEIDGAVWSADEHYRGGEKRGHPADRDVLGTDDDVLYLTQRRGLEAHEGRFHYTIPIAEDGAYVVRLHFAELSEPEGADVLAAVGDRVMAVNVEGGEPELIDFDAADAGGTGWATSVDLPVVVDDGTLNLTFTATEGRAAVAAIEVLRTPRGERWVDIDRTTREVRLMIGETVIETIPAQMSPDGENGFYSTATGTYYIWDKDVGLNWSPYAEAYIAYWAGFDPVRDNGFHSWTMDANGRVEPGGNGPTLGCVATTPEDAAKIWSFVDYGTRVEIHW